MHAASKLIANMSDTKAKRPSPSRTAPSPLSPRSPNREGILNVGSKRGEGIDGNGSAAVAPVRKRGRLEQERVGTADPPPLPIRVVTFCPGTKAHDGPLQLHAAFDRLVLAAFTLGGLPELVECGRYPSPPVLDMLAGYALGPRDVEAGLPVDLPLPAQEAKQGTSQPPGTDAVNLVLHAMDARRGAIASSALLFERARERAAACVGSGMGKEGEREWAAVIRMESACSPPTTGGGEGSAARAAAFGATFGVAASCAALLPTLATAAVPVGRLAEPGGAGRSPDSATGSEGEGAATCTSEGEGTEADSLEEGAPGPASVLLPRLTSHSVPPPLPIAPLVYRLYNAAPFGDGDTLLLRGLLALAERLGGQVGRLGESPASAASEEGVEGEEASPAPAHHTPPPALSPLRPECKEEESSTPARRAGRPARPPTPHPASRRPSLRSPSLPSALRTPVEDEDEEEAEAEHARQLLATTLDAHLDALAHSPDAEFAAAAFRDKQAKAAARTVPVLSAGGGAGAKLSKAHAPTLAALVTALRWAVRAYPAEAQARRSAAQAAAAKAGAFLSGWQVVTGSS
jgi:hypothetical protein